MSNGPFPPSAMASILAVAIFAFIFGAVIVAEKMEGVQPLQDKKTEQGKP